MGWKKRFHNKYIDYMSKDIDYITKNKHDDSGFKESNDGMVKFASLINTIGGIELSEYQLDILDVLMPYVVQKMYQKHWKEDKVAIMKLYGIKEEDIKAHKIASKTARREGKTTFYISLAISAMLSVPVSHGMKFRIALPAQRQETSRETLMKLKERLEVHPAFKDALSYNVTIGKWTADVVRLKCGTGYAEAHAWPGGKVSLLR